MSPLVSSLITLQMSIVLLAASLQLGHSQCTSQVFVSRSPSIVRAKQCVRVCAENGGRPFTPRSSSQFACLVQKAGREKIWLNAEVRETNVGIYDNRLHDMITGEFVPFFGTRSSGIRDLSDQIFPAPEQGINPDFRMSTRCLYLDEGNYVSASCTNSTVQHCACQGGCSTASYNTAISPNIDIAPERSSVTFTCVDQTYKFPGFPTREHSRTVKCVNGEWQQPIHCNFDSNAPLLYDYQTCHQKCALNHHSIKTFRRGQRHGILRKDLPVWLGIKCRSLNNNWKLYNALNPTLEHHKVWTVINSLQRRVRSGEVDTSERCLYALCSKRQFHVTECNGGRMKAQCECEDVSECQSSVTNDCVPPEHHGQCTELDPAGYRCSCQPGYRGDGRKISSGGTGCSSWCSPLLIDNGHTSFTQNFTSSVRRARVKVTCNRGYSLCPRRKNKSKCLKDGTWRRPPSCIPEGHLCEHSKAFKYSSQSSQ